MGRQDLYPDFLLIPVSHEINEITANGVNFEGSKHDMTPCRRFYPHLSPGEGQFVALLERRADALQARPKHTSHEMLPDRKAEQAARELLTRLLTHLPDHLHLTLLRDSMWLTPDIFTPSKGVFAPGVCIGTLQKGRIEPHHQLFSALGTSFHRQIRLAPEDPRTAAYLRGEEIPLTASEMAGGNGYAAVLYANAPLGGGKIVGDRLKNHYPKGLRNRG